MIPVQDARWAEGFRRFFRGKGNYNLTLLDDVMPIVDVIQGDVALWLELGIRRFMRLASLPGVAAQFTNFEIQNPVGSGRLLWVEWVYIPVGGLALHGGAGAGNVVTGRACALAGTPVASTDVRAGNPPFGDVSAGATGIATNAAATVQSNQFQVDPGIAPLPLNFVLPPGQSFGLSTTAVNQSLNAVISWRERHALEEELNFVG